MSNEVPGPQTWPFIGNLLDLRQGDFPIMALSALADQYGSIYRFTSPAGVKRVVISSQKMVNEACDETRFQKLGGGGAAKPPGTAAGLFFAENEDPDWGQAHRTLMPTFGPLNIQSMFDEMHDIAKQLALSWARRGPDHRIDVTDDFTRLTLDSIALCAMGYRFNSFYSAEMHPYIGAMNRLLDGMAQRNGQLPLVVRWKHVDQQIAGARADMAKIAGDLMQVRKDNPTDKKDILNAMLNGIDPKTGDKMRDQLIIANMNTFLIAGHETTSGLLSFAMYSLLKNPSAYKAVQEEVDQVIGKGAVQAHHLKELNYLNAVLRETLRLYPTAPAFLLKPKGSDSHFTLGDYLIESKNQIMVLIEKLHRDPEVYGEDADQFKPERMLDEAFDKLPANAWKPFGNGMRACIGRAFAWQEAQLTLAILFQRFNFRLDDPSYELQMKFALTIKPKDLHIKATLRDNLDPTYLEKSLNSGTDSLRHDPPALPTTPSQGSGGSAQKLRIFYGSNTGTCEALAQRLLADAGAHGFAAETAPLDSINGDMPKDGPVVIVCSSYEGQPPDNAIHFVDWLQGFSGKDDVQGVKFAVYGCGHHDWHDTFHKVPKLIDDALSRHGATRITSPGLCDVADSDVLDQFDDWKDNNLWPTIAKAPDASAKPKDAAPHGLALEVATDKRAQALRQEVSQAVVLDEHCLTKADEPEKRHLSMQLPSDMTYKAGDYLAVLPLNPAPTVRRAMKRFSLPWDAAIKLSPEGNTTSLPSDRWFAAGDILKGLVELSQPPSKKDLRRFIALTDDESEKQTLEDLLSGERSKDPISTLSILERCPGVQLPFAQYLELLPPLRVRLYSISSSPLADPSACSISYGVLDQPASGWTSARHLGVASTYLAGLHAEDRLHVAVRPSRTGFHLPPARSPNRTPVIMICAGTGIAPFRAFVQERALQLQAHSGNKENAGLKDALLFVGCRSMNDQLYADELKRWENEGAVQLRYALSRHTDASQGCKYVQDRLRKDSGEVKALWDEGAKVYICGSNHVVREVQAALKDILLQGVPEKEAMEQWLQITRDERIVADVFG